MNMLGLFGKGKKNKMGPIEYGTEFKGAFEGLKATFIGDGNNMANSIIVGCLKLGMKVSVRTDLHLKPPGCKVFAHLENSFFDLRRIFGI